MSHAMMNPAVKRMARSESAVVVELIVRHQSILTQFGDNFQLCFQHDAQCALAEHHTTALHG